MKYLLTLVIFALNASPLLASHYVCSNSQIYFNRTQNDFGTPPLAGTHLGQEVLLKEGVVLVKVDTVAGQPSVNPYNVHAKKLATLEKTGGQTFGTSVTREELLITKRAENGRNEVVFKGPAICQHQWAFVP